MASPPPPDFDVRQAGGGDVPRLAGRDVPHAPVGGDGRRLPGGPGAAPRPRRVRAAASATALRVPTVGDAPELFALVARERRRLAATLPWLDDNRSEADTCAFLRLVAADRAAGRARTYLVAVRGRIAGVMALEGLLTPEPRLGYWLGAAFEGHGIATAGVAALCREGFAALGLAHLSIAAGVDNARSRAVAERCGFAFREVRRDAENLYGRWVDHAIYRLSAQAWARASTPRLAPEAVARGDCDRRWRVPGSDL